MGEGWASVYFENTVASFSYFSQNIGFDIPCKLSHLETLCMKCQSLFSKLHFAKIFPHPAKC